MNEKQDHTEEELAVPLTQAVDGLMRFMLEQREAAALREVERSGRNLHHMTFVQLPDDLVLGDDSLGACGRINVTELRAGPITIWRQWIELDGMTMRARSEWVEQKESGQ